MHKHQPSSSVLSPGPGNGSPHITIAENIELTEDLRMLIEAINASAWLRDNDPEPRIGHPDCPAGASQYGLRGESVYTVFVTLQNDGTYGCKDEACRAYSTQSLDAAVRHQRSYHFDHLPYACVPASGTYLLSPLIRYAGRILVDPLFSAVAASLLKSTSRLTSKSARSKLSK